MLVTFNAMEPRSDNICYSLNIVRYVAKMIADGLLEYEITPRVSSCILFGAQTRKPMFLIAEKVGYRALRLPAAHTHRDWVKVPVVKMPFLHSIVYYHRPHHEAH